MNIEGKLTQLPVAEIYADENFNCRGKIAPFDVIDLVKSIEKNGLMQPIVVQPYTEHPPHKYRIVVGHRRYAAYEVQGWKEIPAIIKEGLTDIQLRVLNLQENLERKNLNIQQEAQAINKFKLAGYTMEEVAKMLGMSRGWVQVRFSLLELEPEIQQAAAAGFVTQEQIKDLYSLPSKEARFEAVKAIKESKLRGEKKSIKVKKTKKISPTAKKRRKPDEIYEMQEHIIDSVGANFGTRCLAWVNGEISDLELYEDLKELAVEKGVQYEIPTAREESMSSV